MIRWARKNQMGIILNIVAGGIFVGLVLKLSVSNQSKSGSVQRRIYYAAGILAGLHAFIAVLNSKKFIKPSLTEMSLYLGLVLMLLALRIPIIRVQAATSVKRLRKFLPKSHPM